MAEAKRNILILGGGFGGLRSALDLEKRLGRDPRYSITLIDQNTFHLWTPSLYEVATGEISSRSILLPYHRLLRGKRVKFINGLVSSLDPVKKVIKLEAGDTLNYWKLVLALGSDTEDFGVPGVGKYAIGLKSVADAERIREHFSHCAVTKKKVEIVIGGGGFTGVEVAGEFAGYRGCPVSVTVIEAAPKLLPGMPEKISQRVTRRLNLLGVRTVTSTPIKEVRKSEVLAARGRIFPYDFVIWTAGVRGSRFLDPEKFPLDKKKALVVDENLRVKGYPDIYALGDLASTPVPWTAIKAEEEAKVAAANLAAEARGRPLVKYQVFEPPFIVPVGRDWAIAKVGKRIFWGRAASLLKDLVLLYYLMGILPLWQAFRIWWRGEAEALRKR